MKKEFLLMSMALVVCLFIYLFYRTENIVINQIFISVFSKESFNNLQHFFSRNISLHKFIVNSLPEGLWVFCVTLTSKKMYIEIKKIKLKLLWLPIVFAFTLEIFQWLKITNGVFDKFDILSATIFWMLGLCVSTTSQIQHPFKPFNSKSIICICSYCIVLLAHLCH